MSVAIITFKPSVVRAVLPILRKRWPHETLVFPQLMLRGYYEYPLPRGLGWADYPHLDDTTQLDSYRLSTDAQRLNKPQLEPLVFECAPGGEPVAHHDPVRYVQGLQAATEVWAFLEPHPSLCWAAHVLHQKAIPHRSMTPLIYTHLAPDALAHTWSPQAPSVQEAFEAGVRQGAVKAYFDHNFALNSLAILGRTLRTPEQAQPWVSKYQVQALYAIAHAEQPRSVVGWMKHLQDWTGTGHYPGSACLGSALSRHAILEQLRSHGWIAVDAGPKKHQVRLTEQGQAVLARLHPRCEDPDLPFRLQAWMEQGLPEAKPAIDRYLRTFFGRQKRWLDTPQRARQP